MSRLARKFSVMGSLEVLAAWFLGILWVLPLLYAFWSAFHPPEYATRFDLFAPLSLENFKVAWNQAPFARYFVNTIAIVTSILAVQLVLCTLAAYAFARFDFLHVGKAFAKYLATGSKEDAGAVFANQCNGTVFHFGSRVAFGVNIGNFFEL